LKARSALLVMSIEGNRLNRRGIDVVIGYVEPHDPAETRAQIGDLEIVPPIARKSAGFSQCRRKDCANFSYGHELISMPWIILKMYLRDEQQQHRDLHEINLLVRCNTEARNMRVSP
jgi:Osmosensitive K+ channel His kinase sensor domain